MTEFSQNSTGVIQPLLMTPDLMVTYNDLHCSVYTNPSGAFTIPIDNLYSIDLCQSGRCELWLEGDHDIVMNPGFIGLGAIKYLPKQFYYPLNYYQGIKIMFNSRIFDEPDFQKMTGGFSWEPFRKRLDNKGAVVFPKNEELSKLIASLHELDGEKDLERYRLRIMELFLLLERVGLPDETSFNHLTRKQNEIAKEAHDQLANHPETPYKVQDIADHLHVSVSSLNNYFRSCYGDPIPTWVRKYRLNLAADLLKATDQTIAEIATSVGYTNISKFSTAFRKQFSMLPSAYRKYYA